MMNIQSLAQDRFGLAGLCFTPQMLLTLNPEITALLDASTKFLEAAGNFLGGMQRLNEQLAQTGAQQPAPVSMPSPSDSTHPAGSLQVKDNVVTTPGGYKIEMLGQFEWKITDKEGHSTRIWGDPHVDEGDREGTVDWDFKRDTTFVLGDGTRINVKTVPWGSSGMTVTGSLDIISGNDFVRIIDVDKGVGKIGTVTQDGYQRTNDYGG